LTEDTDTADCDMVRGLQPAKRRSSGHATAVVDFEYVC